MKDYFTNNPTAANLNSALILLLLFLFISCDKEVSRSPVEPEPSQGKIIVESAPQTALIFLNGKNTGRYTPDSLTFLDDGIYNITLKKKYFKDTTIVISVENEESEELFVDYLSNPSMYGNIHLFSIPAEASIFLNDSLLPQKTPYTITSLLPGEYTVRLALFDHRDEVINAAVQSSNVSDYSVMLRDTSLWIDYQKFNSEIPSNSLTSVAIDNNNVKWIGSTDVGLIRYDENSFTSFSKANSGIPSNIVNTVAVAPDNKIWVGTIAGLGVFDGSFWNVYDMNNSGLTANQINSVEFEQSGVAWIGTSAGLFRFDGVTWTVYNDDLFRLWVLATKIIDNTIWIGTTGSGIFSLVNETLIHYPDSEYFYPSNKVTSIETDQNGNIWFTHSPDNTLQNGISFFNGSDFTSFTLGTANIAVNSISIDDDNNKWISSYLGLIRYDNANSSVLYSTSNSLISSVRCTDTVIDSEGTIWITTAGGGLNKLKWGSQ